VDHDDLVDDELCRWQRQLVEPRGAAVGVAVGFGDLHLDRALVWHVGYDAGVGFQMAVGAVTKGVFDAVADLEGAIRGALCRRQVGAEDVPGADLLLGADGRVAGAAQVERGDAAAGLRSVARDRRTDLFLGARGAREDTQRSFLGHLGNDAHAELALEAAWRRFPVQDDVVDLGAPEQEARRAGEVGGEQLVGNRCVRAHGTADRVHGRVVDAIGLAVEHDEVVE